MSDYDHKDVPVDGRFGWKVLRATLRSDTICFANKRSGGCGRGNGIALRVAYVEQSDE